MQSGRHLRVCLILENCLFFENVLKVNEDVCGTFVYFIDSYFFFKGNLLACEKM